MDEHLLILIISGLLVCYQSIQKVPKNGSKQPEVEQVVARFPGAAGAPIPVPACAWK